MNRWGTVGERGTHECCIRTWGYAIAQCFIFPSPAESRGNSDLRGDQTAHKSFINSTGIQNDKQSRFLCFKFPACTSLCKGADSSTGNESYWYHSTLRWDAGIDLEVTSNLRGSEFTDLDHLDRKNTLPLPPPSLSQPVSQMRLLFPWQHSWLHEIGCGCGCHGNTLQYIILVFSLHTLQFC